jgi:single-strand DNA-binding protein
MKEAFKNEVHIHGSLVKDPIIKFIPTGKSVTTLTLITKYERFSEFHRIVLWEKLAEKAAEIKKGDFVKVVGRLQTRSWNDKQTGEKKYITEVVGFSVSVPADEPDPLTPNIHGVEVSDADIPF